MRIRLVEYVYFPVDDNMLRLSASRDLQDRVQVSVNCLVESQQSCSS